MSKTMIDPVRKELDEVASVLWSAAERVRTGGPLYLALTAGATYIRELEAALELKQHFGDVGRFVTDTIRGSLQSGVHADTPKNEVIDGYINGWTTQQRRIEELEAEVTRLKAGKLTPDEFNELCHNLHEAGRPLSPHEHEAACLRFRQQLFGTPAPSVADACHEHTSPD